MGCKPTSQDKINEYGLDAVCESIANGESLTAIAKRIEVSVGSFFTWLEAESERSARVREVRSATARLWDEKAEQCIKDAPDEFELKRAKELSHHYRWRAAKIAPKEYGDRLEVEGKGVLPMVIVRDLTGRKDEPEDD